MGKTTEQLKFKGQVIHPAFRGRLVVQFRSALRATNARLVETAQLRSGETAEVIDFHTSHAANLAVLQNEITQRLTDRLIKQGMSEPNAKATADLLVDDFKEAGGTISKHFQGLEMDDLNSLMDAIADQLADGVARLRGIARISFGDAALLKLPPTAPKVWQRNKRKGESSISFLHRVWGPWIRGGVLYQDDIKRLGDDRLVPNARSHCHHHRLDAEDILPPPGTARLDHALEKAEDGSVIQTALRELRAARQRKTSYAQRHRP